MHMGKIFDLLCFVVIKICRDLRVFSAKSIFPKFQSPQKKWLFPSLCHSMSSKVKQEWSSLIDDKYEIPKS